MAPVTRAVGSDVTQNPGFLTAQPRDLSTRTVGLTAQLQGALLSQNAEPVAASEAARGDEGLPLLRAGRAWVEQVRLQDGARNSTHRIDILHGK